MQKLSSAQSLHLVSVQKLDVESKDSIIFISICIGIKS